MYKEAVKNSRVYTKYENSSNRGLSSSYSVHNPYTPVTAERKSRSYGNTGGHEGQRGLDKLVIYIKFHENHIDIHRFLNRLLKDAISSGKVSVPGWPDIHIRWNSGISGQASEGKLRVEFNPSDFTRSYGFELCPFAGITEICRIVIENLIKAGDPGALLSFQVDEKTGEISTEWPSTWTKHVQCTRIDLAQDFLISDERFQLSQLRLFRPRQMRAVVNYINGRTINTVSHKANDKHWKMKIYDKYAERKTNPKSDAPAIMPGHTRFEVQLKYSDLKSNGLLTLDRLEEHLLTACLINYWEISNYHQPLFSEQQFISDLMAGGLTFEQSTAIFYYLHAKDNSIPLPVLPDRTMRELRKCMKSFGIRLSEGLRQSQYTYGHLDVHTGSLVSTRSL
jgi:hypothetical protein